MRKLVAMLIGTNLLYLTFIGDLFGNATVRTINEEKCSMSAEASKQKLFVFLKKVQKRYYELKPHLASTNYDYSAMLVKKFYKPYVPKPSVLKRNVDEASKLLQELNHLQINHTLLKPREERLVHQFRYFLRSHFDSIYEGYYDGIFMLGPDYFCEQAICAVPNYFEAALRRMHSQIKTVKDLKDLISLVRDHKETFDVYLQNVKLGVSHGMVFSAEVCKASSKTFGKIYGRLKKRPEGVLKMKFAKLLLDVNKEAFYRNLTKTALEDFKKERKRSFEDEMREALIEFIGKPVHNLVKYLRHDHLDFCPPSDVSSGLGGLPLPYVYKNNTKTEIATSTSLPDENTINIDVQEGYQNLLWYYTTSNTTADQAYDLGVRLIKEFYSQIIDLAKTVTNKTSNREAVRAFKKKLKSSEYLYNKTPFPKDESDDDAHDRCDNDEDAMAYCPKRWSVFETWKTRNIEIMQEAKPYVSDLFHEAGPKKTTPDCLVKLVADYDPTNGVPSYLESDPACTKPAQYFIPFFKTDMGPSYDDYNTNFHEARPGHHLQIQGFMENFMDKCDETAEWINDAVDYYPSFSEGWGLYAENPLLLKDTGILKKKGVDNVVKYGALKWQIWRALRLVVDVGFHMKNISRRAAFRKFRKYTWDDSDTVEKELTRYQGTPGQATSYTLGQQLIISLRERTKKELGEKFNIKDFHYEILSLGQSPFDYVSAYIDNYISCLRDKKFSLYCDLILGGRQKENEYKKPTTEQSGRRQLIADIFYSLKHKKHL